MSTTSTAPASQVTMNEMRRGVEVIAGVDVAQDL
jgi:hypothetical protein